MKLNELHVDQFRAGFIGQRMSVAGVFPTVACDLVSAADAASCEHDCFGAKSSESPAFAFVSKCTDDAIAIFEEGENGMFHVNLDPLMHTMILQRPDHLETGPISDVREPRVFMATKVPLQNTTILCSIENRAPCFEFAHAIGRLLRVQLGHAPLIDVLATAHGIGEMHFPIIALIDIGQGGRDPPFRHDRVCFAEKRFPNKTDRNSRCRRYDARAQTSPASADYQHIMLESLGGG